MSLRHRQIMPFVLVCLVGGAVMLLQTPHVAAAIPATGHAALAGFACFCLWGLWRWRRMLPSLPTPPAAPRSAPADPAPPPPAPPDLDAPDTIEDCGF
ncbi:hypothetical protein [Candidatus Viridilinea mediisalina]|uniref:Uncharacterized protein n=1 Tax=Candidatus Viridilinea mediisalina TaxID=2024553 RepID=A0A2A6RQ37_9CHLR|nr:hypothetical protein [Candidatus Viridilinea mediisalina]PDW05063.1 hypothetical protein CJ255_00280 [Candidatus Viridilinea mediisalina]